MVNVSRASTGAVTSAAPTAYPTRVVAGHTMVDLPGGWYVQGSVQYPDAQPHWVKIFPFSVGVSLTSEAQYRAVMGADGAQGGDPESEPTAPVTRVSWDQAKRYCAEVKGARRSTF